MLDTRFLRASDGTGPAPIARINTARLAGATVFKVDTVNKWPSAAFIATVGTLNANGYIDPTLAPVNEFRGHLVGSDIILDTWEPGFPNATLDVGNAVNQYIILKQATGHTNLVQESIAELQTEDQTRQSHNLFDYIQTGGILAGLGYGANLNASMTAVTAYINGIRATAAAVPTRAYTANKDTYVDLLLGGTAIAPTLTPVYTEQVNNGTSPVLAANSIRLGVVVTGATNILNAGSINQGQPEAVLPANTAVTDMLGNLINPRDPSRTLLAYRQLTASSGSIGTSEADFMLVPFILPAVAAGRKVKAVLEIPQALPTGDTRINLSIKEGAVYLNSKYFYAGTIGQQGSVESVKQPATGAHTYKASASTTGGSFFVYSDAATAQAFLRIELE